MAVRFVTPIETPYESQFVPMPLDFMYKNIQEKQKGLDTTRDLLGSANLKIDSAPWSTPEAQRFLNNFNTDIEELNTNLEQNKGDYSRVSEKLKSLNRIYNTNPEFIKILKHNELYQKNVEPFLSQPNAESLYFRNLMVKDENGKWKWKSFNEIEEKDIIAPIRNNVEQHVTENLLSHLKSSATTSVGEGKWVTENGRTYWQTIDGKKKEELNLNNDFTKNAISSFANRIYEGTHEQDYYIKEFLGYDTFDSIYKLVEGIAGKGFFSNKDGGTPRISNVTENNKGGQENETTPSSTFVISNLGTNNNTEDINKVLSSQQQTINTTTENINKVRSELFKQAKLDPSNYRTTFKFFTDLDSDVDKTLTDILSNPNLNPNVRTSIITFKESPSSLLDILAIDGYSFNPNSTIGQYIGKEQLENLKEQFNTRVISSLEGSSTQDEFDMLSELKNLITDNQDLTRRYNNDLNIFNTVAENIITTRYPDLSTEEVKAVIELAHDNKEYFENLRKTLLTEASQDITTFKSKYGLTDYQSKESGSGLSMSGSDIDLSNKVFYNIKSKASNILSEVKEDVNKFYLDEVRAISEIPGPKSGFLHTLTKNLLSLYEDPTKVVNASQQTASVLLGEQAGKDYRNNGTLQEILKKSPYASTRFINEIATGFNLSGVDALTETVSGNPMIRLTYSLKDKPEETSSIDIAITENKQVLTNLIDQFTNSSDPKVQEIGYHWLGSMIMSNNDVKTAKTYFNSSLANKKNDVIIKLQGANNDIYQITNTSGKPRLTMNGKPLTQFTLSNGTVIDPNSIDSFYELMAIIGYASVNRSSGGNSSVGKPKPQLGQQK